MGDILLVTLDPAPPKSNEVFCVLSTHSFEKSKTKFCIFIKIDIFQAAQSPEVYRYKNAIFHLASPASSAFSALSVPILVCYMFSVFYRIVHILTSVSFPLLPLAYHLSLLHRHHFRLWFWLWRSRFSIEPCRYLLCGSSFSMALSPLTSSSAFLWDTAAVEAAYFIRPGVILIASPYYSLLTCLTMKLYPFEEVQSHRQR